MEMSEESDLLLWKLHLKLRMENFRDLRAPPRGVLVARTGGGVTGHPVSHPGWKGLPGLRSVHVLRASSDVTL